MDVGKLFDNVTGLTGVEGLWLSDAEGVVHVHRLPSGLGRDPLENARTRIRALYAALDAGPADVDDCLLRYDGHCLLLRRAGPFVLTVLTRDASSLTAVRMLTRLLMRHLSPETVDALRRAGLAASGPEPAPLAVADEAGLPKPAKGPRMYRGQPY